MSDASAFAKASARQGMQDAELGIPHAKGARDAVQIRRGLAGWLGLKLSSGRGHQ